MRFVMEAGADNTWHITFVRIREDQLGPQLARFATYRGATDFGLEVASGYVWDLGKWERLGRDQQSVEMAASIRESAEMEWWENTSGLADRWMEDVRQRTRDPDKNN